MYLFLIRGFPIMTLRQQSDVPLHDVATLWHCRAACLYFNIAGCWFSGKYSFKIVTFAKNNVLSYGEKKFIWFY